LKVCTDYAPCPTGLPFHKTDCGVFSSRENPYKTDSIHLLPHPWHIEGKIYSIYPVDEFIARETPRKLGMKPSGEKPWVREQDDEPPMFGAN
jgi:hypothetical protein